MATVVGTGVVNIQASTRDFEAALKKLPATAQTQLKAAEDVITNRMKSIRAAIDQALGSGNTQLAEHLLPGLRDAEEQLTTLHQNTVQMSGGFKSMGTSGARALYAIGAAADDLQYGFQGILNNIPQIAMAFGKAGLAGGIAIAATAAYQLYKHWDDITALWGAGHTETEAEAMKRLGDATERTANEAERYNRAKKAENASKAQQSGKSKAQQKSEQRINEAIDEVGYENVRAGLIKSGLVGPELPNEELESRKASLEQRRQIRERYKENLAQGLSNHTPQGLEQLDRVIEKEEEELKELINKLTNEATEKFLGRVAVNQNGARDQLVAEAMAHPERFGNVELTPEEIERRTREKMNKEGKDHDKAKAEVLHEERVHTGKEFAATLALSSPAQIKEEEREKNQEKADKYQNQLKAKHDREKKAADRLKAKQDTRQRKIHTILDRFRMAVNRKVQAQVRANNRQAAAEEKKRKAAVKRKAAGYAARLAKGNLGAAILNKSKNVSNLIKKRFNEAGIVASPEMLAEVEKQAREKIAGLVKQKMLENTKLSPAQAEDLVRQDLGKGRMALFNKIGEAQEHVTDRRIDLRRKQEDLMDHFRTKGGSFVGLTDFAKQVQSGALNAGEFQRKALRLWEDMARSNQELLKAEQAARTAQQNWAAAAPG